MDRLPQVRIIPSTTITDTTAKRRGRDSCPSGIGPWGTGRIKTELHESENNKSYCKSIPLKVAYIPENSTEIMVRAFYKNYSKSLYNPEG